LPDWGSLQLPALSIPALAQLPAGWTSWAAIGGLGLLTLWAATRPRQAPARRARRRRR
jgi:hypothetical protein